MKSRKLLVFWVIHITLTVILGLIIIAAKEYITSIGVSILMAMLGNGFIYVGGNVVAAWQKSKYYRENFK